MDLNILATIYKFTWMIMLGSIPHKKFRFYHLPTRGRAGIKLGDAWYVSNVSIIFYCSMILYILFGMFNGLYYTLYIFFCLFQGFAKKEYQTESKRNETFGRDIFGTISSRETWEPRQRAHMASTRVGSAVRPKMRFYPDHVTLTWLGHNRISGA